MKEDQNIRKAQGCLKLIKIVVYGIIIVTIYNILLVNISSIFSKKGRTIFGCNMYIITTDSMRPYIKSGDIILTRKVAEERIEAGDIITFYKNGEVITHRIVEIKEGENNEYITKGDNNNTEDKYIIKYEEILGKEIFRVPLIGKAAGFLQNEIYIVILIMILLTIYLNVQRMERKNMIRREKKRKEDEKFQGNN